MLHIHTNAQKQVDGRSPFDPEEEAAILVLFREKKPWPCFPPRFANIGKRYRSKGYHEKQRLLPTGGSADAASAASSAPTTPQQVDPNDIDHILSILSPEDSAYVKNLGQRIHANYSSADFSLNEWRQVNEIFRWVFLAKTSAQTGMPNRLYAQHICDTMFNEDNDNNMAVMVFDMLAKVYTERAIAQNPISMQMFGQLVNNPEGRITHASELYRVVLAVLTAFHQPGVSVCVTDQKTICRNEEVKLLDICYCVDPESMLFIVYCKQD